MSCDKYIMYPGLKTFTFLKKYSLLINRNIFKIERPCGIVDFVSVVPGERVYIFNLVYYLFKTKDFIQNIIEISNPKDFSHDINNIIL